MAVVASAPPRSLHAARGALEEGGAWWLLAAPLGFLTLFLVGPLVLVAISSGGAGGVRHALGDQLFYSALWRTLGIAVTVTLVTGVLGTAYALALAASRGPVRGLLVAVLLASFWISILIRTLGWELLYEPQGPLDRLLHGAGLLGAGRHVELLQTTAGMYPAMVHVMLPYMVLPIWAGIATIDSEQLRAARGLGGRPLLTLRRIVLPQVRSGLLAGAVLVFTLSLGFYITPRILGGPGDATVGTLVGDQFEATQSGDFSEPAAVGLLLVLAVVVIYTVSDRILRVSESWARG